MTIEAAYSWRRGHELGSIAPGKDATFTMVDRDPLEVDPLDLGDIEVIGTVFEGRWFPVADRAGSAVASIGSATAPNSPLGGSRGHDHDGCSCAVARALAAALAA